MGGFPDFCRFGAKYLNLSSLNLTTQEKHFINKSGYFHSNSYVKQSLQIIPSVLEVKKNWFQLLDSKSTYTPAQLDILIMNTPVFIPYYRIFSTDFKISPLSASDPVLFFVFVVFFPQKSFLRLCFSACGFPDISVSGDIDSWVHRTGSILWPNVIHVHIKTSCPSSRYSTRSSE